MAEGYWIKRSRLAEIANAIKSKTGSNAPLKVINFASAISGIDISGDTGGDGDVLTSALNWSDFNEYDDDNGGYVLDQRGEQVTGYSDEAVLRLFGLRIQDSETEEWIDNWSNASEDLIWLIYKMTNKVVWNVNGHIALVNATLDWYRGGLNVTSSTNINNSTSIATNGYLIIPAFREDNHYTMTFSGKYLDGDDPAFIKTNNGDVRFVESDAYSRAWYVVEGTGWAVQPTCYECDALLTSENTSSEDSNYCQDCWDAYYAEDPDEEPEE